MSHNQLARLSRYLLARIDEIPAGVPTWPLERAYALVQRAKEGTPSALQYASGLWDQITADERGVAALESV